MRITLIGPMPPPVGGATVLFKQLVDDLMKRVDIDVEVINTSRSNTRSGILNLFHAARVTAALVRCLMKTDVVTFHAAIGGVLKYSPLLVIICHLWNKPVIVRIFGGRVAEWYGEASTLLKWIFDHSVLRADVVLLETKSSVKYFQEITAGNVLWYPNSRRIGPEFLLNERRLCGNRFVYVGQVRKAKGIAEIIMAAQVLRNEVRIEVYGPLLDGIVEADFANAGITYRGVVDGGAIVGILKDYDGLLLPTYWPNEGYPGVILEAYMAGIPVITTKVGGIPEIVDSSCGIFIEQQDVGALVSAIRCLSSDNYVYQSLRLGAARKQSEFDATVWSERFVSICASA